MTSYFSRNNYWLPNSECVIIIIRGLPGAQLNLHLFLGPRGFHWHCRPLVAYVYNLCVSVCILYEGERERERERESSLIESSPTLD